MNASVLNSPSPNSRRFTWNLRMWLYLNRVLASLVAQTVKRLPAMRETRVRFLGWEDPLEKGKATHSSILAWRIP